MNMNEREAFEAWCRSEGVDTTLWLAHNKEAGYANGRTLDYWMGWSARAALEAQAEPVAQVVSSVCDEDEAHIRWLGEPLPVGMLLYAAAPQQAAQAAQRAQQAAPTDPTLRELFQTMLASSTQILDADGTVTGYQIKTGAAHKIIGMLGLYVPLNLPAVSMQTPATITRTDAGWKQLSVFGVVIVGRYGESGGDDDTDIEALAARINAAAPSAQQPPQEKP